MSDEQIHDIEFIKGLLAIIEGLADQQAMPDDSYLERPAYIQAKELVSNYERNES